MSRHGVTALAFTALLAGALGAALQESPDPTCQTGISEGKAFCCPKVRCLECTVLLYICMTLMHCTACVVKHADVLAVYAMYVCGQQLSMQGDDEHTQRPSSLLTVCVLPFPCMRPHLHCTLI
jgi:hypothetical protein